MAGGNKTRQREQAIAALLTEKTVEDAASKARVSARTLKGWLADPDFAAAYRAARRQLVEGAVGRLQAAAGKAVDTLEQLLDCAHAPTRARAALGILERSVQAVELTDVLTRLDAMEQALRELAKGRAGDGDTTAGAAADGPAGDGAPDADPPPGGDAGGAVEPPVGPDLAAGVYPGDVPPVPP
jgi:hypothetical protein